MAADYDLRRQPSANSNGELQPLYPQIVSKGTINTQRLVRDISEASSFTPGDIEGVIVSLTEKIAHYLSEGYHVELGQMGYFSAKLKAHRPVMDKKEIRATSIYFDNINFRASIWFRRRSAGNVQRAKFGFRQSSNLSEEARRARLKKYLDEKPFITRRDYTQLTGLLKGKALRELNAWVDEGILSTMGQGSHKVYVKPKIQVVKSE